MSTVRKPKPLPYGDKVRKFIVEFADLRYDGSQIVCNICNTTLLCRDKWGCKTHLNSKTHRDKKRGAYVTDDLIMDLSLTLITCDMPLSILSKPAFKKFWRKYAPLCNLPSTRTVTRQLPETRRDVTRRIKYALQDKLLWLCVDVTTDIKKQSVVNIIVRVLDPLKPTLPLLLASKKLTACTDEAITRVVLETLSVFGVSTSQVVMFVTDDAAIMLLVARSLQENGCRCVHVTWVDALIANMEMFLKSPNRLRAFTEKCSGIPEPPRSVTCWGTWLEAALYYAEHFEQIKAALLQFKPDEAIPIRESQTQFQDVLVEIDLQTIRNNYKELHDAIEKLHDGALSLAESLQVVDDVSSTLDSIIDAKNDCVREKWESLVKQDTGFAKLRGIWDGASDEPLRKYREWFTYACITSVDVERSFSKYKIYSPKRIRMVETTIETYLILQSFAQWCPITGNQATSSASDNIGDNQ